MSNIYIFQLPKKIGHCLEALKRLAVKKSKKNHWHPKRKKGNKKYIFVSSFLSSTKRNCKTIFL
jgi:hypothetical protein